VNLVSLSQHLKITELARSLLKVTGNEYDLDIKMFKENSFNFLETFSKTETTLHKFINTKKDVKNEVAIDENSSDEIEIKKITQQISENEDDFVN
tara:strand:- start:218 stop:502 length:285 start_codon:yes stop_codon:yes gene_type:complete